MPRPHRCRYVDADPAARAFKPVGVPVERLPAVELRVDELEALRLADLEGLYQEQAAGMMGVSRPTFARLVESARRKVADALVNAKVLTIAGGTVMITSQRVFECRACGHRFELPHGTGRPGKCPACQATDVRRAAVEGADVGAGRGRGQRRRMGGGGGGGGRGRCRRGGQGRGQSGRVSQSASAPESGEHA